LSVGFACGFCLWILSVGFACEYSSVSFHLWIFICGLFIRAEYADEVCERNIFWWDDDHTNILLQCEASLHHYITSSHVFFKFRVFLNFISLSSLFTKKTKFSKRTNFS
jgi:hypothetical protein